MGSSQGLPQALPSPAAQHLRLPKEDISPLSLCRNHQWYKNLLKPEGK